MKTSNTEVYSGQPDIPLELTGRADDTAQEMTEGEKLRRLLLATRHEQKELADAIGVTKAAVGKWTKHKTFSDRIWKRLRLGLVALRLNPGDIRSENEETKVTAEDLTKLIENWPRVQLSVIKRILEADDTAREILLAYVNGSLRQLP